MTILQNVFTGSAIDASLKLLAERRTDIFGVGDEETAIGKKIGEEDVRKDEKVTWDGHTSSVEAATRAARANITLEEQIHQIHKVGFRILTGCKCLNVIVTGEGVVA
jgi:splicing factor 3A subunit 1